MNIPLPSVQDKLKDDISAAAELTTEEKEDLYKYIDTLPGGNSLCHFDFHPGNIIMRDHQAVVIDWMTACVGDKLSDIARTGVMLKYAEVPIKSKLIRKWIKRFQNGVYQAYIKEYIKHTGTDILDIEKWEYPIMAARLREWVPESEKRILINLVHACAKKYSCDY